MYILLDIGGTYIRVASSDNSEFKAAAKFTTPSDYIAGLNQITDTITEICRGSTPQAICIGITGDLTDNHEAIFHAYNLEGWREKSLVNNLQTQFNCPVYMQEDVVLTGMGVAELVKPRVDSLILVWGTGFGAAVINVIEGKYRVGKIEWNTLMEEFETKFSGKALEQQYSDLEKIPWPELQPEIITILNNLQRLFMTQHIYLWGGAVSKIKAQLSLPDNMTVITEQDDLALLGAKSYLEHHT